MTITGSNNILVKDPGNIKVDKRCKPLWCIEEACWYESVVKFAEVKDIDVQSAYNALNGNTLTCHGFHLSYEERAKETQMKLAEQIKVEQEELAMANFFRAAHREKATIYKTENEALKKENETLKRELAEALKKAALLDKLWAEVEADNKAKQEREEAKAKAKAKVEAMKRICEQQDAEYQRAIQRLMEAEKELKNLNGDVKE